MIDKIQEDLKQAQLARDEIKVSTLRLLLSEIKNAEIAKGVANAGMSEQDVVSIIQKEAKKRVEAVTAYRNGGREELAQKEEAELAVLKNYLPEQLSTQELTKIVQDTINEVGATGIADMGKVMGVIMGKVRGRADGISVSSIVKEKLSV